MKCKIVVIVVLGLLFWGCENRYTDLDLRVYQYRDTKDLGKFVDDASQTLKKDDLEKDLEYFRRNRVLLNTPDRYLQIYDMNGLNIYHSGMPHLEGKNRWDVTDMNGKKPLQMVVAVIGDKNNPHACIHY